LKKPHVESKEMGPKRKGKRRDDDDDWCAFAINRDAHSMPHAVRVCRENEVLNKLEVADGSGEILPTPSANKKEKNGKSLGNSFELLAQQESRDQPEPPELKQKKKTETLKKEVHATQESTDDEVDPSEPSGTVRTAAQKRADKKQREKEKKKQEAARKKIPTKDEFEVLLAELSPAVPERTAEVVSKGTNDPVVREEAARSVQESGAEQQKHDESASDEGEGPSGTEAAKKKKKKKKAVFY
jgi:hypothetical protein